MDKLRYCNGYRLETGITTGIVFTQKNEDGDEVIALADVVFPRDLVGVKIKAFPEWWRLSLIAEGIPVSINPYSR